MKVCLPPEGHFWVKNEFVITNLLVAEHLLSRSQFSEAH